MTAKRLNRDDADRMLPLLRSIGREIRERTKAVANLEEHLDALSINPNVHAQEVAQTEAQLSTHRRELRRCEREIHELGCNVDADDPLRILIPSTDGALAYEGKLDGTQFYRRPLDAKA
jgi:DNA-binding transcriptional regulator/RsmH inhibitor MraZ